MIRDPIFRELPAAKLFAIARLISFDPIVTPPSMRLSQLSEAGQELWLDAHRDALETHLSFVGSSIFQFMVEGGKSYRQLVIALAERLHVVHAFDDSTANIERAIVLRLWQNTLSNLNEDQRQELIAAAEKTAGEFGKTIKGEMAGFAALTAAQLSGFGVYLLGSTLLGAVNGALGLGLSFGVFTGLSSLISTVIGPIGWATLGLITLLKLGGPNYKKILPVVILIAIHRSSGEIAPPVGQLSLPVTPIRPSGLPGLYCASLPFQRPQFETEQASRRAAAIRKRPKPRPAEQKKKATRNEKVAFALRNRELCQFLENLVPDVHYLDLDEAERTAIDELFREQQRMQAEAKEAEERLKRIRELEDKRESRLVRKGKTEKAEQERKDRFTRENPGLVEVTEKLFPGHHYLELNPADQADIRSLVADESSSAKSFPVNEEDIAAAELAFRRIQRARSAQSEQESKRKQRAIERQRKLYGDLCPSLSFSDEALFRLCDMTDNERSSFHRQFRLMQEGKEVGKHDVPRTSPRIWQLDVSGTAGKVYYRRLDSGKMRIELVGWKQSQDSDYALLRRKAKAAGA